MFSLETMKIIAELNLCLLLLLELVSCSTIRNKPKLSFEEFFDHTEFPALSFSPNGQHLLIQTRRTDWNASVSEDRLWLYEIATQRKKVIARFSNGFAKLQWSPSGNYIAFFRTDPTLASKQQSKPQNQSKTNNYLFLYAVASDVLLPFPIDIGIPSVWKWSSNDSSLFLAVTQPRATENEVGDREEWRDVIQYRESLNDSISALYRLKFNTAN